MRGLEVNRINGQYLAAQISDIYERYGVVVLKDYLPTESRDGLRSALEARLEAARVRHALLKFDAYPKADFLLGDVLAARELADVDYLFFRAELLAVARTLLRSETLIYWGDSSIQYGEGARGYHKDNVARSDGSHNDWQGSYGLIRCGFYFQDHVHHSGGLKVRLGSHNIATHHVGKRKDIESSYGDLVVWSMRLTHSGNNRKLKLMPKVSLHPRIEMNAPSWLIVEEQMRRISAFCAFARPGGHLDTYIDNMKRRDADYMPYFRHARNVSETQTILAGYGIRFIQPVELYGELDL
jgi:hypothetical protein